MRRNDDPASDADEQPFATEAGAATAHLPEGPAGRRWRAIDRLVVAGFIVGLVVPALLLAGGLRPRAIENRPLRTMAELTVVGVLDGSWAAGVDAFLADNIALRQYAIRARGELYWRTGGTGNPQVIRGLAGWLFIRGEFQPTCRFSGDQLAAALTAAAEGFAASAQDFRFLLVPDKHSVYPDRVRPELPFPPSCEDEGRAALGAAIRALGPVAVDGGTLLSAARRANESPDLFYARDSHWTPSGAIVAIRELVRSLDPALWRDEDVVETGTVRRVMDLATLIGIRRVETTPRLAVRPGVAVRFENVSVPVEVRNARQIVRATASGDRPILGGRTVIVYDSFFGIYMPLVAPFFADSTWIHVGDLLNHPELAAMLGPFDRIVFERVERGLYETDVSALLGPLRHVATD